MSSQYLAPSPHAVILNGISLILYITYHNYFFQYLIPVTLTNEGTQVWFAAVIWPQITDNSHKLFWARNAESIPEAFYSHIHNTLFKTLRVLSLSNRFPFNLFLQLKVSQFTLCRRIMFNLKISCQFAIYYYLHINPILCNRRFINICTDKINDLNFIQFLCVKQMFSVLTILILKFIHSFI